MSETISNHVWHKCKPGQCKQLGTCPYCDGGLGFCTVCKCAEGTLPAHCPGVAVDSFAQDEIYHGTLDYINGEWVEVVLLEG